MVDLTQDTSNTSPAINKCIEALAYALTESVEFYTAASGATNAVVNRKIFNCVAIARTAVLASLQAYPERKATAYAFGSALQKVYPDMFCGLIKSADPSLVVLVHKHEAKLQNILQDVLLATTGTDWHWKLVDLFPQANGDHMPFLLDAG